MIKENELLFKQVVKTFEKMIEGIREEPPNDYREGVIDGLIIAIRTIEGA